MAGVADALRPWAIRVACSSVDWTQPWRLMPRFAGRIYNSDGFRAGEHRHGFNGAGVAVRAKPLSGEEGTGVKVIRGGETMMARRGVDGRRPLPRRASGESCAAALSPCVTGS
eukprot:365713-Chlamydomonas_euryale.AAC.5